MCTVLLPPGANPSAVNKYIISFTHLSYQWAGWIVEKGNPNPGSAMINKPIFFLSLSK